MGYPDGYRDPEWDGTEAQFRDIVIPARSRAIAEKLNAGPDLPDGMRFERAESASPDDCLLPRAHAVQFDVSRELLADCAGMGGLIGKALRGEIELRPPPPPKRHRCLACRLVSLLPGHPRCGHGYLEAGCDCGL